MGLRNSRLTTQILGAAIIVILTMTWGYVLPTPSHTLASNRAEPTASLTGLAGPLAASPDLVAGLPILPGRSAGCALCSSSPSSVAVIVQLTAVPLPTDASQAFTIFSAARVDANHAAAQRQPDPLERPPAA